jgi:uncharacterized protein YjbJ (UPF0337 family)
MRAFPWIIAGIGIGVAACVILNPPVPEDTMVSDDVEHAARRTFGWGTKQRATGAGQQVVGKIKEGFGNITGNDDLAGEGVMDQVAGATRDAAGSVAHAVGETIHDLNR